MNMKKLKKDLLLIDEGTALEVVTKSVNYANMSVARKTTKNQEFLDWIEGFNDKAYNKVSETVLLSVTLL